ncbi:MAG: Hsp20/alpha crystallin family protein [Bacteroidetes bacterium]|nr:Hsp20/alpha crystallin family protein [Bacteroidota bacterium]MBL0063836.1 Hsp20/alpha crystallin family protein [Bacteroidota bacterium]MBL0139750.1 Hsp20/alpha crystallin family protein [Bacteroidota bacterium]
MTLVKFKNAKPVDRFTGIPSIFSDFFSDFVNEEVLPRNVFKSLPAVNISELPESYRVELAAPGMSKGDFKIEVENGVLTIKAEKKEEKQDENSKYTRKEFSYTSFSRTFTMPDHVNTESISAEYVNGVLTLVLPKREEAKKKPVKEIAVS